MSDENSAILGRLAALEILVCQMLAETAVNSPDGTAAGLIKGAIGKVAITPTPSGELPKAVIETHLDSLLQTAEAMRRRLAKHR